MDTLKKACETQLKKQGIDVGVFVVDSNKAYFKQGTREEVLAAKKVKKGSTMYVLSDPNAKAHLRMMKAVKDEGMPTFKNPFINGNLFLILTIEFPDKLTPEAQKGIRSSYASLEMTALAMPSEQSVCPLGHRLHSESKSVHATSMDNSARIKILPDST